MIPYVQITQIKCYGEGDVKGQLTCDWSMNIKKMQRHTRTHKYSLLTLLAAYVWGFCKDLLCLVISEGSNFKLIKQR